MVSRAMAKWSGAAAGVAAWAALGLGAGEARATWGAEHEVWLVDQSNSPGKTHGGTAYIWRGSAVAGGRGRALPPEVIDLGGEASALCERATGALPVRPHMLVFNGAETHAALAFVASGHVLFLDAASRRPVACLRTTVGAGGARQAHAAWPTSDDRYLLVANQNGKRLERIRTDYAAGAFVHEPAATLDLATCTTPGGLPCEAPALRPDNAPICPFVPEEGGPAFISLRGGGLFLVDPDATPMKIVAEYDERSVKPNGCGFIEARGFVYFNSGGGTATHLDGFDVYRLPAYGWPERPLPPGRPPVQAIFSDTSRERDAHGVAATLGESFVWVFDRAANFARIFHARTGLHVNRVDLTSPASADPTPDLAATAPDGQRLYLSLRGPNPLSADPHASTGSTPGLGVVQLTWGGASGYMRAIHRISNVDAGGVERADAHAIRVRRLR